MGEGRVMMGPNPFTCGDDPRTDGGRPDPIGPNDEYEWCDECEDHHAWECYYCGAPSGQDAREPCCNCGRSA